MPGYIYDPDLNEHHVPDEDQCELCTSEAVRDGLCLGHWEDGEERENKPERSDY